jgi:hypothetical protein
MQQLLLMLFRIQLSWQHLLRHLFLLLPQLLSRLAQQQLTKL